MKKLIFCSIAILSFAFAKAQTQKQWTLQECVQYALDNNISIQQSELDLKAVDADRLSAIGNLMPSLSASTSLSENTGLSFNPVTNNAQTTTFLSATGRINVGYTVFNGLRNFRQLQRAEISQIASQYRLDKMKDDIALAVANNYLQILTNKANLETLIAQNLVTKEQVKQTQTLVDAGQLPKGDLLEIKATDAGEQQQIIIAQNAVTISKVSLAQLLLIENYVSPRDRQFADQKAGLLPEEFLQKMILKL